ncbi:Bulb-type lectin domain-containing protein [Psidium guajava]|nr:Bulb-type lectin domain-containing protein [Psidium guajava]
MPPRGSALGALAVITTAAWLTVGVSPCINDAELMMSMDRTRDPHSLNECRERPRSSWKVMDDVAELTGRSNQKNEEEQLLLLGIVVSITCIRGWGGTGWKGGRLASLAMVGLALWRSQLTCLAQAIEAMTILDVVELDGNVGREANSAVRGTLSRVHLAVRSFRPSPNGLDTQN